jgi:membrane-associated protein
LFHSSLIPWLNPYDIIHHFGNLAVLVVCIIIFLEIAFLVAFLLPGDSLLLITGLLAFPSGLDEAGHDTQVIHLPIVLVILCIGAAAFLGGEVGHFIGRKIGPRIFERKETGVFSRENVERTNKFFVRFGGLAIILACFVPVIRTFAPVAAGVGHMRYRQYGLFNLIGAFLWATVITGGGYLLGFIPPVAHFVTHYIDVILIVAVLVAVVPTAFHYIQAARRTRKANNSAAA